jgi:hypothetical protein
MTGQPIKSIYYTVEMQRPGNHCQEHNQQNADNIFRAVQHKAFWEAFPYVQIIRKKRFLDMLGIIVTSFDFPDGILNFLILSMKSFLIRINESRGESVYQDNNRERGMYNYTVRLIHL